MLQRNLSREPPSSEYLYDSARVFTECHLQCEATGRRCAELLALGHAAMLLPLQACVDCADVCRTTAALAARRSRFALAACRLCAEVADRCAVVCDDKNYSEHLAACADECRECARVCREILELAEEKQERDEQPFQSPQGIVEN
jgi:hypothetical protein